MKHVVLIALISVVGCSQIRSTTGQLFGPRDAQPEAVSEAAPQEAVAEEPAEEPTPVAVQRTPGWDGARQTIAGLGDPAKPGRWLETPLVKEERNGRIVYRKTGASAQVALVPIPGAAGSGSNLSLDAMRALLAPLDELIELDVYSD